MLTWSVQWSDWGTSYDSNISLPVEAIDLVKLVTQETSVPTMIEFFNNLGASLSIGVGRDKTVLTYQQSNDPPYFVSLGDKNADGTEWFCYGQEESEYFKRNLVSIDLGYSALVEFISSGNQPTSVDWEEL